LDNNYKINVLTSSGNYPVIVGWNIFDQLMGTIKNINGVNRIFLISDKGSLQYANKLKEVLQIEGLLVETYSIESGEIHKNLNTVIEIYKWLSKLKAERKNLLIGVGGGVVGDLSGFIAATYLRGIYFGLVPTTLLAMVDSSIGGKVAVDLESGKNLVGAFYQPKFVLDDISTLNTLSDRELTSGWAEVVKHALIFDSNLFDHFEQNYESIKKLNRDMIVSLIGRSIELKANCVSSDEKETKGQRILLNYGHTIAHALESLTSYTEYLHGEAVSIGMMGAAYISEGIGVLSSEEVNRQKVLLERFGLPTKIMEKVNLDLLLDIMQSDKKIVDSSINWVVLNGIGSASTCNSVPKDLVISSLKRLMIRD
tara:strand:+ start:34775 stop:35878 length:1104 start_codon:yes stop_codon:yes gene_type:complete